MNETVQHHRQPPGRAGMALTLLTYVLLFSVIIVVVTISDALPVWGDVIMLLSFTYILVYTYGGPEKLLTRLRTPTTGSDKEVVTGAEASESAEQKLQSPDRSAAEDHIALAERIAQLEATLAKEVGEKEAKSQAAGEGLRVAITKLTEDIEMLRNELVKAPRTILVKDVMSTNPAKVLRGTPVASAANWWTPEEPLPVVDQVGRVVGVLTHQRVVEGLIGRHGDPNSVPVENIAQSDFVKIRPGRDIEEARRLLAQHRLDRILVVEEGDRLVGTISESGMPSDERPSR
jgi:hypothetical protein